MKFCFKIVFAVIPALVLLGCGTSGEVQEEPTAGAPTEASSIESGVPAETSGVGTDGAATGSSVGEQSSTETEAAASQTDQLDDSNSLLAKRVVYFDFDKSEIKGEFRDIIQAHAEYLANNPSASLTLEGHCDERGTREYNIALGDRRANAVQRMLTVQGAAASQIRTVSYGEERPAALGHDGDAWSLNRRAEFIYNR